MAKNTIRGPRPETATMDLTIWLPSLFILGLVVMALMFAFLAGCDRV